MRRLYSTFAGGWPGIGLLLMRLVVGAVILWYVGPRLWSGPPLLTGVGYAFLVLGALLLIAGLWTPVAGVGGRRCRDRRDPHDGRTSHWSPARRNHRGRAGDARTRPGVDRCPAVRMEAHRPTSARPPFHRELTRARGSKGPLHTTLPAVSRDPLQSPQAIYRVVAPYPPQSR